jgi:hypothetical protein
MQYHTPHALVGSHRPGETFKKLPRISHGVMLPGHAQVCRHSSGAARMEGLLHSCVPMQTRVRLACNRLRRRLSDLGSGRHCC